MKIKNLLLAVTAIIAFAMTVRAQTIPSYIPANGLVAWYPFNGNANDESGNGNNGTVNGATLTTDRNGNSGKAYSFDGVDDYIKTSNISFANNVDYTISLWVNLSVAYSSGYPQHYLISNAVLSNGAYLNTDYDENQFGCNSTFSTNTIGNWHHYLAVKSGNNYTLLIDNITIGTQSNCNTNFRNGFPLFFGNSSINTEFTNGKIDDIAIYNRALTQTEITQLYTNCVATTSATNLTIPSTSLPFTWNGLTFNASGSQTKHLTNAAGCDSTATLNLTVINTALPSYLPANGLVAWYPFNGNANDESGNGNHGTVNGAALTSDRLGINNKSYTFNSQFRNIVLSNVVLNNINSYTISVWVKNSGGGTIFCGSNFSSNTYGLRLAIDGNNIVWWGAEYGTNSTWSYTNQSYSNNWHLVTAIFSSNSGQIINSNNLIIYIDGILQTSNQRTWGNPNSVTSPINNNNLSCILGNETWGNQNSFNGQIDDIAIYNRALTQTEITELYSSSQNTIKLNLTAFLEGSNLGNSNMTATLNKVNAAIPNSIADSIIVELHASTSPYATMYSSNGVLNTNGTAAIAFPNSAIGSSYYIAIKHRNAIETWSAAPVAISNHTFYNFTTSASQAYGNNLSNLGDGVFGMFSGDITQDGAVDFNDYPSLDIASNNGILGYNVNDLNGDASVDFNDYPILDINSNNGIIAMRP